MAKKEEGFDPPVIKELTLEEANESINRMSEMINLLLSKIRRLTDQIEDFESQ